MVQGCFPMLKGVECGILVECGLLAKVEIDESNWSRWKLVNPTGQGGKWSLTQLVKVGMGEPSSIC